MVGFVQNFIFFALLSSDASCRDRTDHVRSPFGCFWGSEDKLLAELLKVHLAIQVVGQRGDAAGHFHGTGLHAVHEGLYYRLFSKFAFRNCDEYFGHLQNELPGGNPKID